MSDDVCKCGSLMHRDGECDAIERVISAARWHAKYHRTGKEDGCPVCISLLDLDDARAAK